MIKNDKKYKTLLIDPPWKFRNDRDKSSPTFKGCYRYSTMLDSDIKDLQIKSLLEKDATVLLWVCSPILPKGVEVLRVWGLEYKASIVWEKVKINGGTSMAGLGHLFRNSVEYILIGNKGKGSRKDKIPSLPNLIRARPREHSRKPDQQYSHIESVFKGPYIELFARAKRKGWDSWGNELEKFDES